ncbi:MAG: hypothetical protein AAGE89_14115 [Pseudomonadota bacterium]
MARFDFETIDGAVSGGRPLSADVYFDLGLSCSTGRHGSVDLVAAHKWFNLAVLSGNEDAKTYREEIARELSRDDMMRALKAAREWQALH